MNTTKIKKGEFSVKAAAKPRRVATQTPVTNEQPRSTTTTKAPRKHNRDDVASRNGLSRTDAKSSRQRNQKREVVAKKEAPIKIAKDRYGVPLSASVVKPARRETKMARLLNSAPAPVPPRKAAVSASGRPDTSKNTSLTHWLLYCRPGFESDCTQEAVGQARRQRPVLAEQPGIIPDSGYAIVAINEQMLDYSNLIFARQLIRLHHIIETLPERYRLTPIMDAIAGLPGNFGAVWLEVADTNDGKTVSAFIRRFQPLLETALQEQGRIVQDIKLPRLHLFFPDKSSVLIGTSDPYNSSASIMGISRQSMPSDAPSRSTLKLAEAIEVFLDKSEQTRLLRSGMTAVDLGSAPGGWSWQMVKRGIRVVAVDNGDMKGSMAKHPLVEHLRQDGFKFEPRKSVDWLICDMVEKPAKVAELMGNWFSASWCKHAIFNLKLPMKQRVTALDAALGGIRSRLEREGISYKLSAKQLYHDREEITVFLTRTKNR